VERENLPFGFPWPQHDVMAKEDEHETEETRTVPVLGLESPALRHVRENAKILTRKAGLFDAETWSGAIRYVVSLTATWLIYLLPLPSMVFLLTMLIPETVWCRFDPLFSSARHCNYSPTWLATNRWMLTVPLVPVTFALLLGYFQFMAALMQQGCGAWLFKFLENVKEGTTWLMKPCLFLSALTAAAVIMVFGVWGVHWLLALNNEGGFAIGETVLGLLGVGGLGVAGASARKLTVPKAAKNALLKVLPKIGLAVGGYVLLFTMAFTWYYLLWALVSRPDLQAQSHAPGWEELRKWLGVFAMYAAAAAICGPKLLNALSLNFLYEERILRTWVMSVIPPRMAGEKKGDVVSPRWKVRKRPDLTMGNVKAPEGIGGEKTAGNEKAKEQGSPLQLVVTALNTTGSKSLQRRDRRAECFVISPVTYGSIVTGWGHTESAKDLKNMRLSHAAAISGAAVSPNMGMRTQPTLSVVMTLLNIRLGAWVVNPAWPKSFGDAWAQPDIIVQDGLMKRPRAGLRWCWEEIGQRLPGYYWQEMIGKAFDRGPRVYLSDGGHFENLGIYELLRRRCRYIIAVDATGEPANGEDLNYGGIGIPLRLARVDFGVEVDINLGLLERDATSGQVKSYFAVGRIRYPRLRGDGRHGEGDTDTGYLVLIKSGLVQGTLTPDILNYLRQDNPRFPYDSTLDQQFDQAQFESYRQLGYIAGRAAAKGMQVPDGQASEGQNKGPGMWFKTLYDSYQKRISATQGH